MGERERGNEGEEERQGKRREEERETAVFPLGFVWYCTLLYCDACRCMWTSEQVSPSQPTIRVCAGTCHQAA